ncbi:MAG: ribulose-phosphate 3-epimerase [Candidatus Faecivicinus sp.]
MNSLLLSASVMCVNAWDGMDDLRALKRSGVELLHADVMDGEFVPNLMLGTESIRQLRRLGGLPLDIHLMIERPEDKLGWFDIQPGEYVSVHAESTRHLQRALARIRELGARPVAALNPGTPLCMVEDVLPDVEAVLLMTVNPGYAGQALVPQTIGKIARLRRMLDDAGLPEVRIEVDGNVSFENGVKMRAAGADMLVCGTSSIFRRGADVQQNVRRFRELLGEAEG